MSRSSSSCRLDDSEGVNDHINGVNDHRSLCGGYLRYRSTCLQNAIMFKKLLLRLMVWLENLEHINEYSLPLKSITGKGHVCTRPIRTVSWLDKLHFEMRPKHIAIMTFLALHKQVLIMKAFFDSSLEFLETSYSHLFFWILQFKRT